MKKMLLLVVVVSCLLFVGCSAQKTTAQIMHLTGIMSDQDYESYIQLLEENRLNPDNSYTAPELAADSTLLPPDGSIHVTFAQNSYIEIQYYRDAGLTDAVDPQWCYLMPGDCVYASVPNCEHPASQWYTFDRFCTYAYDESGKRAKELSWGDEDDPALVLRIPADSAVSEVSVVPMGKYEKRTLELMDYYMDNTGHQKELDGTWIVNDAAVSIGRVEVNAVESLSVDYQYDDSKYDFVSSNPASFYHEKGLVRFELTSASQDISQYSVELRSLEGMFPFDPSQYPVENGSAAFWYNGRDITEAGTTYIPDGESITYILTPAEGYRSPENIEPITINASDPDKTNAAIKKAITFYPDSEATVYLPQPPFGGTITYTAEGRVLSGQTCTLPSGTIITMEFNRWDGWIVDPNASKEYTVEAALNQSVNIEGSDFDTLFTEAESHKPTLNLILSDNMKDATFTVTTSDLSKSDLSYASGSNTSILGLNGREIFGGGKIGTGSGVKLTVTGDTPSGGEAMKLEITTKDSRKKEQRTIQYVTDLSMLEEPIQLYDESQRTTSSIRYENVTIKVSKVEVATYTANELPHATVSAKFADEDTPHILQNGDVLESSREVEITLIPDNGYYIEGTRLDDGTYSEKLKYSKWEKESEKILEKHPAQKLWYVTLDTSDSYGTCVYKLDNTVISSTKTVGIRKGQKLTLEYTLTDSNYQISRKGAGGLIGGVLHSDTESVSITVSEALDGQTVRRSDYVTVEEKGE